MDDKAAQAAHRRSASISWAKNHMIDPQEYFLNFRQPAWMKRSRTSLTPIQKGAGFKANALDFDDLLLETVRLLKASE